MKADDGVSHGSAIVRGSVAIWHLADPGEGSGVWFGTV